MKSVWATRPAKAAGDRASTSYKKKCIIHVYGNLPSAVNGVIMGGMGGQALLKHAKHSHWPLQSCRTGHLLPADPGHPTCCWVSPPALSSAAFLSCTLPISLVSPRWLLEGLSASYLLYSAKTGNILFLFLLYYMFVNLAKDQKSRFTKRHAFHPN